MKICINGKTRDMTPKEEAEFLANTDTDTDEEATESDYIDALQDLGVEIET